MRSVIVSGLLLTLYFIKAGNLIFYGDDGQLLIVISDFPLTRFLLPPGSQVFLELCIYKNNFRWI